MARTIPASYPKPDPDLSFIPGSGKLDDGSGTTTPPHGPRDIALALNYLFGKGLAGVVVPQIWREGDEVYSNSPGFAADPDLIYQIPADTAFPGFRVSLYYLANRVHAEGFKVVIPELAEEITFASEAAGGAQRLIEADWEPAGLDTYAGDSLTVEVYVYGDPPASPGANRLCGVFIQRTPRSGTVPSGIHYDPPFIGIDQTAIGQDSSLAADILGDMRADIVALKDQRKRIYLQWSRQGGTLAGDFGGFISTLAPVLVTGRNNARSVTVAALGEGAGTVNVCGGRAGIQIGAFSLSTDLEAGIWTWGDGWIEGAGLLPIENPYAQVIGQVGSMVNPPDSNLQDLRSLSVWGA